MKISLVVPVYNEQDAISIFYDQVRSNFHLKEYEIEIIFVDDGSSDNSAFVINELIENDKLVRLIELARNFGKEAALFAGLEHSTGDAVIPIDVDLQDPIDTIHKLIDKWLSGADIVLAKRIDRSSDTRFKRKSAELFYKLHNKISDPKIEENVGDFRLISRKIVDNILLLPEKNLFMKGVLSWVGGRTEVVEYSRTERIAGESKFNFWKLWNLALEGITSFSTAPLRVWTYIGFGVASLSFIYSLWLIADKVFFGNQVPGYPSLMASILFIGGVQLIGIGVLGEYIGRIYIEVKNRPRYIKK